MLANIWNKIVNWFRDFSERNKLLRSFNDSAREAFVKGEVPAVLQASVSRGDSAYRHHFSKWLASGFRVKVICGRPLTREEMIFLGNVILEDAQLVRRLVILGWDTLEVHGERSARGYKWKLSDHITINLLNNQ